MNGVIRDFSDDKLNEFKELLDKMEYDSVLDFIITRLDEEERIRLEDFCESYRPAYFYLEMIRENNKISIGKIRRVFDDVKEVDLKYNNSLLGLNDTIQAYLDKIKHLTSLLNTEYLTGDQETNIEVISKGNGEYNKSLIRMYQNMLMYKNEKGEWVYDFDYLKEIMSTTPPTNISDEQIYAIIYMYNSFDDTLIAEEPAWKSIPVISVFTKSNMERAMEYKAKFIEASYILAEFQIPDNPNFLVKNGSLLCRVVDRFDGKNQYRISPVFYRMSQQYKRDVSFILSNTKYDLNNKNDDIHRLLFNSALLSGIIESAPIVYYETDFQGNQKERFNIRISPCNDFENLYKHPWDYKVSFIGQGDSDKYPQRSLTIFQYRETLDGVIDCAMDVYSDSLKVDIEAEKDKFYKEQAKAYFKDRTIDIAGSIAEKAKVPQLELIMQTYNILDKAYETYNGAKEIEREGTKLNNGIDRIVSNLYMANKWEALFISGQVAVKGDGAILLDYVTVNKTKLKDALLIYGETPDSKLDTSINIDEMIDKIIANPEKFGLVESPNITAEIEFQSKEKRTYYKKMKEILEDYIGWYVSGGNRHIE